MKFFRSENNYKLSYYNYLHTKDNITILYNTYTGAQANITKSDRDFILHLFENLNNFELRNKRPDIFAKMIQCGFIVKEDIHEIDFIRFRYYKGAFSVKNLSFTLLPTRACNFRCIYCFEDEINESMNADDCHNVLAFVKRQIKEQMPQAVSINWYGGEPLLKFEIIKNLSEEFIEIFKTAKIEYQGAIVTNGYLLDDSIAKQLLKLGIKIIQITLDGPEEIHDKRRPLRNGGPTYGKVKAGIISAKKYFDSVDIRINVDRDNLCSIRDFLETEEWLYGENTTVRPGRLRDYTDVCSGFSPCEKGFSAPEFYDVYKLIRGLTKTKRCKEDSVFPAVVPVRSFYCGAQVINTYTIGPRCFVYKCTASLDHGDEVGIIENGKFQPNERFVAWFLREHPTYTEPCKSCKMLPMCMGGCRVIRLRSSNHEELKNGICRHFSLLLNTYLESEVEKLKKAM